MVASSEVMFVREVSTVGEEEEVSDAVEELEETPPGGRHGSLWIRDET